MSRLVLRYGGIRNGTLPIGPLHTSVLHVRGCGQNWRQTALIRQRRDISLTADSSFDIPYLEHEEHTESQAVSPRVESLAQYNAHITATRPKEQIRNGYTFERWLHESAVTGDVDNVEFWPRLVDDPTHGVDFSLWIRLLDFRLRVDGHQGAWDIFQGLKQRSIDIPTDGIEAQLLWDPIVTAAISLGTLGEIWDYIRDMFLRTDKRYGGLYRLLVGCHLHRGGREAVKYHRLLLAINLPNSDDFRPIINTRNLVRGGSEALWNIYKEHREDELYDSILASLCANRQWDEALKWHFRLVERKDFPTEKGFLEPLLQHLRSIGRFGKIARIESSLSQTAPSTDGGTKTSLTPITLSVAKQTLVYSTFDSMNLEKSMISDEFIARAFATRAFTPGFVIRTLNTFGIRTIGPLAVRELAVRCQSLINSFGAGEDDPSRVLAREVRAHLDHLQSVRIAVKDSAFTRFVTKLAQDGDGSLLESVLSSDQHPDVYDDSEVQLNLLASFVRKRDWKQVHRTLALLTMDSDNVATAGWNLYLRTVVQTDTVDHQKQVLSILRTMRQRNICITNKTLRHSFFYLMSLTTPSKQPANSKKLIHELDFLTRIWLFATQSGMNVPPSCWNIVLRRYGQLELWSELERLCIKLAHLYSSKSKQGSADKGQLNATAQLNRLFSSGNQCALVEWYMKSLQYPHLYHGETDESLKSPDGTKTRVNSVKLWARGLALLRELELFGLDIDVAAIRKTLRHRLIILYGEGLSNRRHNRVATKTNPYSLAAMVRYMQRVWRPSGILFQIPRILLVPKNDETQRQRANALLRRLMFGEMKPFRIAQSNTKKGHRRSRRPRWHIRYRAVYVQSLGKIPDAELEDAIVNGSSLDFSKYRLVDRRTSASVRRAEDAVISD